MNMRFPHSQDTFIKPTDFKFKSPAIVSRRISTASRSNIPLIMNRRQSMLLKRLESNLQSPPVARRTRRQSVTLQNETKVNVKPNINRAISDNRLPKGPSRKSNMSATTSNMSKIQTTSSIKSTKEKLLTEKVTTSQSVSVNEFYKSPSKVRSTRPLRTRRESMQMLTTVEIPSNAIQKRSNRKPPKAGPPRKGVKRLSTNTPLSAAKKQVKIAASNPTTKGKSLRKTPKASSKKDNTQSDVKPFTPKPEEPGKLWKQAVKEKISKEILAIKKNAKDDIEILKEDIVKLSTPPTLKSNRVSNGGIPTTPKSTRKVSVTVQKLRAIRKTPPDVMLLSNGKGSNENDLEEEVGNNVSSTPKGEKTPYSPLPDPNLTQIDAEISVSNGDDIDSMHAEEQEVEDNNRNKKGYCTLM